MGPRPGVLRSLLGLTAGLVAILALGAALAGAAGGMAFVAAALRLGWHEALMRAGGLLDAARGDPAEGDGIALVLTFVLYAAIAVAAFVVARLAGGRLWRDRLGWHRWSLRGTPRRLWLLVPATLAYGLAATVVLDHVHPAAKAWVALPQGGWAVALFFVDAVLAAPVAEELVFRGWLFTGLRARFGLWTSLLGSSVPFALAHWEGTHLYALVVLPIGLAIGLVRERTGSLRSAMAFHALHNGVAFALLYWGS